MKFLSLLIILISTIFPMHLFSQCAGGLTPQTISYDTIVYGNGNSSNTLSFPKFDPSLGTLLSADIKSVIGLQYSYNLYNQTPLDKIYKAKIVRTDDIYSTALDPSSIDAVNQTPYVSSSILAHQHIDYGPAQMNYTLLNSITDGRLINFMGHDTIDFDYETGTSASVQGPLPWQLNFTAVNDTTEFSITYRYCNASILSSDLLYFAIAPVKDKILLNWRQANIMDGRLYNVQISADGQNFVTVSSVTENNTGLYSYAWFNNASKKMYFRIQEKNISGEIKYSNIRESEISHQSQASVKIFPTLYTGGNLQASFPDKGDWQINFYSADGRLLVQTRASDVYTTQLGMPLSLVNGIYTAQVINRQTQQTQVTRIIVQR